MMMEKGTVNSSGEREHHIQKFLLCDLSVSAFPSVGACCFCGFSCSAVQSESNGCEGEEAAIHFLKLFPFS